MAKSHSVENLLPLTWGGNHTPVHPEHEATTLTFFLQYVKCHDCIVSHPLPEAVTSVASSASTLQLLYYYHHQPLLYNYFTIIIISHYFTITLL